jgi:hypothetical protein
MNGMINVQQNLIQPGVLFLNQAASNVLASSAVAPPALSNNLAIPPNTLKIN